MYLHLCDFCGDKMARAAAILAIAPPENPSEDVLARQMARFFGGGGPVKQFELCGACVTHLLGIKEHVEAVRPPVKAGLRHEDVSSLMSRMYKDYGPP